MVGFVLSVHDRGNDLLLCIFPDRLAQERLQGAVTKCRINAHFAEPDFVVPYGVFFLADILFVPVALLKWGETNAITSQHLSIGATRMHHDN